ncbi:MAG: C-GCAxxG-C-C family protein [Planctomycetota bacterium]|jgi:C_GCAxxG_C_C family probable redox protein|nr:C-GCAxxG-C-C family protein [Planctomycetota bacterium]
MTANTKGKKSRAAPARTKPRPSGAGKSAARAKGAGIRSPAPAPAEGVDDLAKRYFYNGYHCAEAILKAFNERLGLGLDRKTLQMATGLSAGLGKAKCLCGCLSSGGMILGCLYGRTDSRSDETLVFDLTKELHERFTGAFGHACCRILTKNVRWGHPDHTKNCGELVRATAAIVKDIVVETEANIDMNKEYKNRGVRPARKKTYAELLRPA